jgi:hypothetical protein
MRARIASNDVWVEARLRLWPLGLGPLWALSLWALDLGARNRLARPSGNIFDVLKQVNSGPLSLLRSTRTADNEISPVSTI